MKATLVCLLATVAAGFSIPVFAQAEAQNPNPDAHYHSGPDSLPEEGVPKGEIRGPFTLPSQAYPGTSHTYWIYVPAQYRSVRGGQPDDIQRRASLHGS